MFAVKDLTIEIACPVTAGIPKPAISWYHNSVKIISNGLYSRVKENNDLLIPKLDASLQGVYKCAAENMEGRDEASTTIMIMSRPFCLFLCHPDGFLDYFCMLDTEISFDNSYSFVYARVYIDVHLYASYHDS